MKPKPPPPLTFSNPGAEARLLGFYLTRTRSEAVRAELLALELDLFRENAHRAVLQALQAVAAAGDPVDLETVGACLRDTGSSLGASILLVDLADPDQAGETPGPYLRILQQCHQRRKLDAVCRTGFNAITEADADLAAIATEMRRALDELPTTTAPRFRPVPGEEMRRRPRVPWLVAHLLPASGFAVLSGEPGSGKTFLALDMALHVAAGLPWQGRAVQQGAAVYVAAEAQGSIPQRLEAWGRFHGIALPETFYCIPETVLVGTPDVGALAAALRSLPAPPVLVVFDTLSWCLGGGDENASEAMSAVLETTRLLHETIGCAVLWVHHPSAAGKSLRGHTSLRGGTDAVLLVSQPAPLRVRVACDKMKDAAPFEPFHVALRPLAADDGAPLSCVVVPSDPITSAPTLTPGARTALNALATLDAADATYSNWLAASGLPKTTFVDARAALLTADCVRQVGGRYELTALGSRLVHGTEGTDEVRTDPPDQGQGRYGRYGHPLGSVPPYQPYRTEPDDDGWRHGGQPPNATEPDHPDEPLPEAEPPCVVCGLPSTAFSSDGDGWCIGCWQKRVGSA